MQFLHIVILWFHTIFGINSNYFKDGGATLFFEARIEFLKYLDELRLQNGWS